MQSLAPIPSHVVNLHDHEIEARKVLPESAWAYFSGGAADEFTLRANASAWQQMALLPRVLTPLQGGHTRCRLLGRFLPHPILLAPMAYQRLAHPDGELATAIAAAAQGAGLVLSTQSSTLLEEVAQAFGPPHPAVQPTQHSQGPLWFQLYWQSQQHITEQLVTRAEAAGFEALVLTVDAPVHGARDRERRAQFVLPDGIRAVNLPATNPQTASTEAASPASAFDTVLHHAPTWADVRRLVARTRLPVLLKGILHPDDARTALDCGVAGVIVSNHGGRTLDTAITTVAALPAVAQAVGDQMAVLVDGGLRRGTDVFKALALGAHAVLIGRPFVHALAHAGAMGVAHAIRLLRDELEIAMALCGCATLDQIAPAHLVSTRHDMLTAPARSQTPA
jgi:4-hydroxymandelate oxidase